MKLLAEVLQKAFWINFVTAISNEGISGLAFPRGIPRKYFLFSSGLWMYTRSPKTSGAANRAILKNAEVIERMLKSLKN